MSEKNIYQRMIEVQKLVKTIQKNEVVKMFENDKGYKAVTHDDVASALHLPLADCGIFMLPDIEKYTVSSFEKLNNYNKMVTWYRTDLDISVKWINADKPEDFIVSRGAAFALDTSDKSFAKAYSLALKIVLLKVHLLESRDGEESRPFDEQNGGENLGKDQSKNKSNQSAKKPENKTENKTNVVLDPKDFIMPFGVGTKGKKLSSLSLETLTDISKYVEGELKKENKTEALNQFLLVKANVLKVISTFPKKENKETELPKEPRPDAGDSIIDIDFDTVPTESINGKTLKMIPEKTLLAMIAEIDKKMQSVPPPPNLTALFSINSNIKAFLKSCEV